MGNIKNKKVYKTYEVSVHVVRKQTCDKYYIIKASSEYEAEKIAYYKAELEHIDENMFEAHDNEYEYHPEVQGEGDESNYEPDEILIKDDDGNIIKQTMVYEKDNMNPDVPSAKAFLEVVK